MAGELLLGDTVDLEPKKTHFVNMNGIFDTMETSIKEKIIPRIEKKLEKTSKEAIGDFTYNGDIGQFLNIDKICEQIYKKALDELTFGNLKSLDMASANTISSQFINGGVFTLKIYDTWNNSYKDKTYYMRTIHNGRINDYVDKNNKIQNEYEFILFSTHGFEHSIEHMVLQSIEVVDEDFFNVWLPDKFVWQTYSPDNVIKKFITVFKEDFEKWWDDFKTHVLGSYELTKNIDKVLNVFKHLHEIVPEHRDIWLPESECIISKNYDARALYHHWRDYAQYLPALWPNGIKRWMNAKSLHKWVNDKMLENLRVYCAEDGDIWMPIVLKR